MEGSGQECVGNGHQGQGLEGWHVELAGLFLERGLTAVDHLIGDVVEYDDCHCEVDEIEIWVVGRFGEQMAYSDLR